MIGWGEKIFYPADDDDYEWDDDDNDWWEGWDDDWAGWRDDDVGETTYRPTYQPTSGSGTCDYTATPLAYDSSDCPANADGSIFPNCDEVACGELCEGDGECGTDTQLNNCPSKNYDPSTSGGRLDIYRKVCDRSTKQHTKQQRRRRPPKSNDAAADARVLADVATDGTIGNTRRTPRAARGLGDGRADGRVRRSARTAPRAGGGGVRVGGPPPLAPEPKPPLVRHVFPR